MKWPIIWKNVDTVGYRTFWGWKENQTINIEVEKIPEGWVEDWDQDCDAQIVYAYTGD